MNFALDRIYRIDRIRKENPDDPVNPVKIFIIEACLFLKMIEEKLGAILK